MILNTKRIIPFFIGIICILTGQAQTIDTSKIYGISEILPRFQGCDNYSVSGALNDSCSTLFLMEYIRRAVQYPEEARSKGTEGKAIVRFVVERNGSVSTVEILKDPGNGLGNAAKKVIQSMNDVGLVWTPGKMQGTPVRCYMTVPISFKLEEELPYQLFENGDTLYHQFDTVATFVGGDAALEAYISNNLQYPSSLNNCKAGVMQATLLVKSNGKVDVLDIADYHDLGSDANFEAIKLLNSTVGKWHPALYNGKPVSTTVPLRIFFVPQTTQCAVAKKNFENARKLAGEAQEFVNKNQLDNGISKLNEAIALDPENMEFYFFRGTAYLNAKKNQEACADLTKVQQKLSIPWINTLLASACQKEGK